MMIFCALLKKTVLTKWRDRFSLLLTLFTSPVFVLLVWMFFSDMNDKLNIAFFNETSHSMLQQYIKDGLSKDQKDSLNISFIEVFSKDEMINYLKNEQAHVGLHITNDFESSATIINGIVYNTAYVPIREKIINTINSNILKNSLTVVPIHIRLIGPKLTGVSVFSTIVPGLIVFSIIMMIFSTSIFVAREIESKSMIRIKMAGISSLKYYFAITIVHILEGVIVITLTVLTAMSLGLSINSIATIYIWPWLRFE